MVDSILKCVAFDCDGVLVDNISSWGALHKYFKTDNSHMLKKYIEGEITDDEFMLSDIVLWKSVQKEIHQDDLFRAYSGIKLMPGAREVVAELKRRGILVVIISAGVDIFVSSIASMLKVDDWIANGFKFDEEGWLLDEGILRVGGTGKGILINRILAMHDIKPENLVSVGDSDIDLSMMVEGSSFIGFNPTRDSSTDAFENAGVPIVTKKDLREIWPFLYFEEIFPEY